MKKSFTLLEIIFAIAIVSIVSIMIVPKLFIHKDIASNVKIKSDIALIRSSIIQNRNQNIINGKGELYIPFLDDASINTKDQPLFVGYDNDVLLEYKILS